MIVKRYPHYTRYTSLIQNLLYVLLDYTGTGKWKPTNPLIKKEQRTRKSSGLNDHIWEKTSPLPPHPHHGKKKIICPTKPTINQTLQKPCESKLLLLCSNLLSSIHPFPFSHCMCHSENIGFSHALKEVSSILF